MDTIQKAIKMLGGTQIKFAEAVGISQGLVSQLVNGEKRPGWKTAIKIEKATGGKISREELRPDIFSDRAA